MLNNETETLPLDSTFAMNLALHTALAEACKILDNPAADAFAKLMAENTIKTILETIELPEE